MKTYWDYEEKERAAMTEEQVRSLLDVELMTKGVAKVEKPIIQIVPERPELETTTWYECGGILFKTIELANDFTKLKPHTQDYDYSVSSDLHYATALGGKYGFECDIKPCQICNESDIKSMSSILKEIKTANDYNDKVEKQYDADSKVMADTLNGVWGDWQEMQSRERQLKRILSTFNEYVVLSDGDTQIAATFLSKQYSEEKIIETNEWLECKIPIVETETEES